MGPNINNQTIAVAMSGGVDSSVAAALLVAQGHRVIGITMTTWHWPGPFEGDACGDSFGEEAADSAARVARSLGIDHVVVDLSEEFKKTVVADFVRAYAGGSTPNPCVICNQLIKFDLLHHKARELGADMVATGHYARLRQDAVSGRYLLLRPADSRKDQTYMLYRLGQEQLARSVFPLGDLEKVQVRKIAKSIGLEAADRPESQEICFLPPGKYREFLASNEPSFQTPGPIVNTEGHVIGEHRGIAMYTVGQRKGLSLAADRPLYVLEIRPDSNTIIVGPVERLYSSWLEVESTNFIPFDTLSDKMDVQAKIRYRSPAAKAVIFPAANGRVRVEFNEPQRAITPGQSAVFYDGDLLVGGGIISSNQKADV
ncbi:MAG TPA: tRNA 2-thiouridine(34) synthase MnmA [Firmicutes bacterium]|nr:tRNA 2-thiouridine(34) synthase MnmA [Bacillota bacterium]